MFERLLAIDRLNEEAEKVQKPSRARLEALVAGVNN